VRDATPGPSASAAQPIPFRPEVGPATPDAAISLLLVALAGFAVLVVLLRWPRLAALRARLGIGAPPPGAPEAPRVLARRRVSAATSVLVIAHGGREYLLVESARQVVLHPVESGTPSGEGGS
jgi:hypothetical protein